MHESMYEDRTNKRSVWRGALSGALGGLAAAWVMNQFQAGVSKASSAMQQGNGEGRQSPQSSRGQQQQSSDEDATQKAAQAISEATTGRTLTKKQKQTAGPIVHYAFGSLMGAAYGSAVELAPLVRSGWGLPFGTLLWLGADEVAVPAFGLSQSPMKAPASTHASALASHLVYGATADVVRRAVRALLRHDDDRIVRRFDE